MKFLLIGVAKCGTTSTSKYIQQHPQVIIPYTKEPHCFWLNYNGTHDPYCQSRFRVWKLNDNYQRILTQQQQQQQQQNVDAENREIKLITGDLTPVYQYESEMVIPRVLNAFPWAKLLSILRNPIDRLFSSYNMKRKAKNYTRTLGNMVVDDLMNLYYAGLLPHYRVAVETELSNIRRSTKEANGTNSKKKKRITLQDWLDFDYDQTIFDEFHLTSEEEMAAWSKYKSYNLTNGYVARGLYGIQLRKWMSAFPCERFLVLKMENYATNDTETGNNNSGDDGGAYDRINVAMKLIYDHLGLQHVPITNTSAKNTAGRYNVSQISDDAELVERVLLKFYQPYNNKLYKILGEEWANPW